jgi:hypothetical protein
VKPRVRAMVYVTDFRCSADEISKAIAVQPTRAWAAGDRIGPTKRTHDSNGWELESSLVDEWDPEKHLKALLDRLPADLPQRLRRASPQWCVQFSLVLELHDQTPPFNLAVDTVQRIAELGASVDVDLYVTGSDTEHVPSS